MKFIFPLIALSILTACGGGDSGSASNASPQGSSTPPPQSNTTPPVTTPPPTRTPNTVTSTPITGVTFDLQTHQRLAVGSDNWPTTWSDDDNQYSVWGDGGGFGGTD